MAKCSLRDAVNIFVRIWKTHLLKSTWFAFSKRATPEKAFTGHVQMYRLHPPCTPVELYCTPLGVLPQTTGKSALPMWQGGAFVSESPALFKVNDPTQSEQLTAVCSDWVGPFNPLRCNGFRLFGTPFAKTIFQFPWPDYSMIPDPCKGKIESG